VLLAAKKKAPVSGQGTLYTQNALENLMEHLPTRLSLGPLEREIIEILWARGVATNKDIHEYLLRDPDRELAYTSVTNVLKRLVQKGWLTCDTSERIFRWYPLLTKAQAEALLAHDQLQKFLAITNSHVMAALAEDLGDSSIQQLEKLLAHIQAVRRQREN